MSTPAPLAPLTADPGPPPADDGRGAGRRAGWAGDLWGGLAAMLVALPSAIAYGVAVFAVIGPGLGGQGALAGILGATALGLLAPMLGGAPRLITAPCAPAAAVLTAFAIELAREGMAAEQILLLLGLLALSAGLLQVLFGLVRLGKLIEYMPFPVVSGYLTGVGLIIIGSQVGRLLGAPKDMHGWTALTTPAAWHWESLAVGVVTIGAMLAAPLLTRRVPAAILGLGAGLAAYFGLAALDPALRVLEGNPFVIGALSAEGGGFLAGFAARWSAASGLEMTDLLRLVTPALTLAVLLSIDTLKTCVVLDALTRSRHDSNRELIGQGLGNMASGAVGGIPGAGTMGATMVNLSGGGTTRLSGAMEGAFALLAFLLLAWAIAWIPLAALAGILIVVGARMIDRDSLHLLRARSTILDFAVIAAVVAVALTMSLIAASAVGIVLAVALFIREQAGNSVIRRKTLGNEQHSKRVRTQAERELLAAHGQRAAIVELQGSLFFGTAAQLYKALEPELKNRDYLILDMRRVQSVDVTAVHMLSQVKDMLGERRGFLILSQIPQNLPSGRDMEGYFDQVGLLRGDSPVRIFPTRDEALEWVEDRLLAEAALDPMAETLLDLHEIELFVGRKEATLSDLERHFEQRHCVKGERIFARGDTGDELFLIRRGAVRILLPLEGRQHHHIGTFGRGAFFGEMAFLDGEPRSADAIAFTDTDLYVLSRKTFDGLAEAHKKLALQLMEGLASVLASRLRYTNAELRVLES